MPSWNFELCMNVSHLVNITLKFVKVIFGKQWQKIIKKNSQKQHPYNNDES